MFMLAMAPKSLRSEPPATGSFRRAQSSPVLADPPALFENILEHQIGVEPRALTHRAEGDRFLPARRDQRLELGRQRLMTRLGPFTQSDQMLFEPQDGIAQGPVFEIILGAITCRVVAGGMRGPAIRHQF